MSETPEKTGADDQSNSRPADAAAPAAGKGKTKKPKKPGRWRHRFWTALITIISLSLILRILLSLLLPWTVRRVARVYGLDCTFERADIYLTSGDAGLWHLRVNRLDDGSPVAQADYCRADLSLLQLFRGRLVVQRLEADGWELIVQRNADGKIPLLTLLMAGPQTPAAPAPKTPGTKPSPIDLMPPVAIDALRLTHVNVHFIDQAVTPALDTWVRMNFRFSDLASPIRPAKLSLELMPDQLWDSMSLEAQGTSTASKIDATFAFSARGLHPAALRGYLQPLGIQAAASGITFHASGAIKMNVLPGAGDTLAGGIQLSDIALTADGQDAMSLRDVSVDVGALNPLSIDVTRISVNDGSFLGRRTERGNLSIAGLELSPGVGTVAAASAPADPSALAQPVAPANAAAPMSLSPIKIAVGEVALNNFRASFRDDAVKPAAELKFNVDDLSIKGVLLDALHPGAPVTLAGSFSAPGITGPMHIDGTCRPFAEKKTLKLNVKAEGVRPDALLPYLAMAGIQSDLQSGTFTCKATADLTLGPSGSPLINARLTNVNWGDGAELLALDDVHIAGLGFAPGSIHVESIDVKGPCVSARREKSGALWAAGFRLLPGKAVVKSTPVSATSLTPATHAPPATTAAPAETLPKLDIGRFTWNGVKLQLDDQMEGTGTSIAIEDAGVELTNIHVNFDPKAPAAAPGQVRAWLKAPGIAGALEVKGTVTQLPSGLAADLELTGENLSANLAAPYLKALNIEPTLRDGSLRAKAHVDLTQEGEQFHANVSARDVSYSDAGQEMLGIDKASISDVDYKPGLLEIGAVTLDKPRAKVMREAGGAIRAGGIRLIPAPPVEKKSAFAAAPAVAPATVASPTPSNNPPIIPATAPATSPAPPADVLVLKKLTIHDAALSWTDDAVAKPAKLNATVNGDVSAITWGKPADPTHILFTLKADGIADELKIDGTLAVTPTTAAANLLITARGLTQGALASYLPPGTAIDLKDGRLRMKLDAAVAEHAKGGIGARVEVSKIDYRDGETGPGLFELDSANIVVSRLDLADGVIAIDEISAKGAETAAKKSADGTIHVLGLALSTPPPPSGIGILPMQKNGTDRMDKMSVPTRPVPPPISPPIAQTAPAAPVPPVAAHMPIESPTASAPLVIAKPKYPLITLKKLDVNLRKLTFTDQSRPEAAPAIVSDLRLVSRKPIEVLGEDFASRPPVDLALSLRVDHAIDSVKLTAELAPFASPATVQFDISATGIQGDGLLALAPELKPKIEGSKLKDGRFHLHGETQMKIDRLDPLDFSLSRGFDADLLLKGLEYRAQEKGEVLAGIDELRSENMHVNPKTGSIRLALVELNKITARAALEKDGLHALGVVVKLSPPPATQPSTQPVAAAPAIAAVPQTSPATAPAIAQATLNAPSEIRVGRISISGIDLRVEDRTVSPPLVVPINQLDLEVKDLTSRAMVEEKPVRFSLLVGADKVPLPQHQKKSLGNAMKDAASLLGPKKVEEPVTFSDRELFSQVQADGLLSFYPQPKGWVKTSVSAFDLSSLKAEAKQFGVDLQNGVFDTNIDVRLVGDGSMNVRSNYVFTDLELAEKPDGPIAKFLHLKQPIDTIIGLLQDQDGSIDVPLAVGINKGHISGAEVAGAAVNAFGAIVVTAVASSGAKAAGAVTDLAGSFIPGLGGGDKGPKKEEPILLTFSDGDDALDSLDQNRLAALIQRMKSDPKVELTLRHDLGFGDVARAAVRANPSHQDCLELVNQLGRRKQRLQQSRAEWAGRARSDLASRSAAESAATLDRLHTIERDLAATEDALDHIYELLGPGADSKAERRTRQVALAIALSRIQAVRSTLLSSGIAAGPDRVRMTRPRFNPSAGAGKVEITITLKKQ